MYSMRSLRFCVFFFGWINGKGDFALYYKKKTEPMEIIYFYYELLCCCHEINTNTYEIIGCSSVQRSQIKIDAVINCCSFL